MFEIIELYIIFLFLFYDFLKETPENLLKPFSQN